MLVFSSFLEFLILRLGLQSQEMEIVGIISQHAEVGHFIDNGGDKHEITAG
jgi:hypothetical protein